MVGHEVCGFRQRKEGGLKEGSLEEVWLVRG